MGEGKAFLGISLLALSLAGFVARYKISGGVISLDLQHYSPV